jgi:hypothetical protein
VTWLPLRTSLDAAGVVVYRPEFDFSLAYIAETAQALDPATGERLSMQDGHNQSMGAYYVGRPYEVLLMGGFYSGQLDQSDDRTAAVYDIAAIVKPNPEGRGTIPADYDVGRLARFIRVLKSRGDPHVRDNVIVLDSRAVQR